MRLRLLIFAVVVILAAGPAGAQSGKPRELGVQDSKRILSLLNVGRGDSVAVIGASSSFVLPEMSAAVGPSGKVYIVDFDRTAIQGLQHRIREQKFANVTAILGTGHDALLPERVDSVLMINSYRLLENREAFLNTNRKYLAPDTNVAIIDYYRRPMTIGPPVRDRVASHRVMREFRKFGFAMQERHNISAYQYFLVYRLVS